MGSTTIISLDNDRLGDLQGNLVTVMAEITLAMSSGDTGKLSYGAEVHSVAHRDNNVLLVQYGGKVYNLREGSADLLRLNDGKHTPFFGDVVRYTEGEAERLREEFRKKVMGSMPRRG